MRKAFWNYYQHYSSIVSELNVIDYIVVHDDDENDGDAMMVIL